MKACLPDLSFCNNPNFKKKIRGVPDPLRALAVRGPLLLVGELFPDFPRAGHLAQRLVSIAKRARLVW